MALGMNNHIYSSSNLDLGGAGEGLGPLSDGNPYLDNAQAGLQLCAELVAVGEDDNIVRRKLAELEVLVEEKFLPLTEADYNPTGAAAYRDLKRICTDLEALVQFPQIEQFYTVAVGGMFSAGKSRFLNSVLGSELLPTDTNPTTSIPTYITQGSQDSISVLNRFQSRVTIDADALQAICHAFHDRFGVSFAHILRLVHVQRRDMKHPGINLLDTPGYSKSDSLSAESNVDERLAREHLRRADFLIWLVDIQNGTIPQDDLQFIRGLDYQRPILFVLSKADKKTEKEIEQTLAAARKDLARAGDIQVYGVTAYSAAEGQEYAGQGCLQRFFEEVSEQKPGTTLGQQMARVFSQYMAFYESEKLRSRQQRGVLNEVALSSHIEQELNERAKALAAGVRLRIEELNQAEGRMEAIRRDALRLLGEIVTESGLLLADEAAPMLRHAADLAGGDCGEVFRFQGIMNPVSDAVLQKLLKKPNLENLCGTVRKVDSICLFFDVEGGMEGMATLAEVRKVTGWDKKEIMKIFDVGTPVGVHLREQNRCTIIFPALNC